VAVGSVGAGLGVVVELKTKAWSDRNVCFTLAGELGLFARTKGVAVVVVVVVVVVEAVVVLVVVVVVVVVVGLTGESTVIVTVAARPTLIANALNW
jgi:hypothetical protein